MTQIIVKAKHLKRNFEVPKEIRNQANKLKDNCNMLLNFYIPNLNAQQELNNLLETSLKDYKDKIIK